MEKCFFVLVLIFPAFFLGCSGEENMADYSGKEKIIVALGDSLSAGYGLPEEESYPYLLQKKLDEDGFDYKVVNMGVSAEVSSETLERLPAVSQLNPAIVILEIGANDGFRQYSPDKIRENIETIVESLISEKTIVVLAGMKMAWNLGPMYTVSFNEVYLEIAEKYSLIFMPFFLEDVALKSHLNLADGVHPNGEGYKIIVENLYPYVVEAIEMRN